MIKCHVFMNGKCRLCPNRCNVDHHSIQKYIFTTQRCKVINNDRFLKAKYDQPTVSINLANRQLRMLKNLARKLITQHQVCI
jgi:hypothetical protein